MTHSTPSITSPAVERGRLPSPRRAPALPSPLTVSAISLFVDDLPAARRFYLEVFRVRPLFEDDDSIAVQFENVVVNLLRREAAGEIVAPGTVGSKDAGSRFQLSLWVPDVDAVCRELRERGVRLLQGPVDRPWGLRTANFVDPSGHSWEVAQRL